MSAAPPSSAKRLSPIAEELSPETSTHWTYRSPLSALVWFFLLYKMFAQSLRASRSTLTRCLRQPITARRTFITPTAIRQVDIIQDMYLRELKAYKPAPIKATDAEGQVKQWKAPALPPPPAEGTQGFANELAAYEAQEVEVEGAATEGGAVIAEQDWFEEDIEDEPAKH